MNEENENKGLSGEEKLEQTAVLDRHKLKVAMREEELANQIRLDQAEKEASVRAALRAQVNDRPTETEESAGQTTASVGPNTAGDLSDMGRQQRFISKEDWRQQKVNADLLKFPFSNWPHFFYGGFFKRMLAYLIDLFVVACLQNIMLLPGQTFALWPEMLGWFPLNGFLRGLIFLAYFILMTKLNKGQTLGKMVFSLRVVSLTEEKLSWETVLLREGICRFFQSRYFFLYLTVLFNEKRQTVGDLLCDTTVIKEEMVAAYQLGQAKMN